MREVNVISAPALKHLIDSGRSITLIDVREPSEYALCHIAGSRLIPLGELANHIDELDVNAQYIIYCHIGERSAYAVAYLTKCGFKNVRNLQGGIDAWAEKVDSSMPRY